MRQKKLTRIKKQTTCRACEAYAKKIDKLRLKLKLLQEKYDEIVSHPTHKAGLQGEELIVKFTNAEKTKNGSPYDVKLRNGQKVEIKFSKPTTPIPGYPCQRWVWSRVYGVKKKKTYDWLLLVGEKPDGSEIGKSNKSRFVYFLLRKKDVANVVAPGNKSGHITLVITDRTRSLQGKYLWQKEISRAEITRLFTTLTPAGKDYGNS